MSWRGSSGRSLPNGSLTLPFSRSLQPSLSWVEGGGARDQALLLDEEEGWTGNQTLSSSSSSSSSSSFQEEWCHMSPTASVCLVVCYCLTLLLGLVGNCFLIGMIARRRERANVTSVLIANLSVSDILVCAFCLPFTVTYTLMDHWVFGSALCRLVPFVQCVSVTVSILSLVLIALERHQLIINPSGWRPSVPQAYGAVVVIWVLACLTSLPFLAFHLLTSEPHAILSRPLALPPSVPSRQPLPSLQPRDLEPSLGPEPSAPLWPSYPPQPPPYSQTSPSPPLYSQTSPSPSPYSQTSPPPYSQTSPSPSPPKRPFPFPKLPPPAPPRYPLAPQALPHMEVCMEHWPSQQHKLAYTTWLLLFQYCVPLFLVLLCYVRVYVRLRRRRHMLDRTRTPENQRVSHSRRVNVMLVALVTAFTLCWLPLTVFNAVSDWYHEALPVCHHDLLFSLCHLLAMLSTCVNPVIYGFLNSNFRQEVREGLLHCRCRPLEDSYRHFPLSTVQTEVSRASTSLRLNCRSNSV